MRRFLTLLVLSLTLSATGCQSLKDQAVDAGRILVNDLKVAGKDMAADIAKTAAEKGAEAAANAVAAKVQADDNLAPEEKADILKVLYAGGAVTIANILAALRMWASARVQKAALGIVVKGVDKLPPEIAQQVKDQVTALGGSAPAIKKTITAAKS